MELIYQIEQLIKEMSEAGVDMSNIYFCNNKYHLIVGGGGELFVENTEGEIFDLPYTPDWWLSLPVTMQLLSALDDAVSADCDEGLRDWPFS